MFKPGGSFVVVLKKQRALLQMGDSHLAARDLLALVDMINQAVGDALSGILLVEAALRRRKWGLSDWFNLYTDLPSRQLKVSCHPVSCATKYWPTGIWRPPVRPVSNFCRTILLEHTGLTAASQVDGM